MDRTDRSRREGPLWLSVLSVALIVMAVVGALAATQRLAFGAFGAPTANAISSSLTISTDTTAGILRPQGAAFSPDGSRIAVIGAFTPCHQMTPGLSRCGHGLAIYNSHSGSLIHMSPIEPLLGVTTPPDTKASTEGSDGYVQMTSLGWSPDSAWFAIVYTVFDDPNPSSPDDMLDSGLLLVSPQTGSTQIIRGDSGYFATLNGQSGAHPIWHLDNTPETVGFSVAPGIVFAWGGSGAPFPTVAARTSLSELPVNAGARYPVGQPDGSAPFTIWQPGVVIGPGSASVGAGGSAFVTTFTSWSADGRHLGEITAGVTLPTPVRAEAAVSARAGTSGPAIAEPATLPAIPARDVALAHVQESVGAYGWAAVAWNPPGTTLASVVCFARNGQTLELRDTVSGALIASAPLRLAPHDPGCHDIADSNLSLVWSPSGSTLATVDRAASTITLWSVNSRS